MKYIITFILVSCSLFAAAQDLNFKIAGATQKKWIGDNLMIGSATENTQTLTFYKNHTVTEYDTRLKKAKPLQHWQVVTGVYLNDENIVLQIGKKQYHVEFSTTANGKDFMTLSTGGGEDEAELVIRTYHEQ